MSLMFSHSFEIAGGFILAFAFLAAWYLFFPSAMDAFWRAVEWGLEHRISRWAMKGAGFVVLMLVIFFIGSLFGRGPLSASSATAHQRQASAPPQH